MNEVCAVNIGPRQQRLRMHGAYLGLGLGVVLAAVLVGVGVAWPWRATVFLPFLMATLSWLQARRKT